MPASGNTISLRPGNTRTAGAGRFRLRPFWGQRQRRQLLVGASRQRAAPRSQFVGHGAGAPRRDLRRCDVHSKHSYRAKFIGPRHRAAGAMQLCSSAAAQVAAQPVLDQLARFDSEHIPRVTSQLARHQESNLRGSLLARLMAPKCQRIQTFVSDG